MRRNFKHHASIHIAILNYLQTGITKPTGLEEHTTHTERQLLLQVAQGDERAFTRLLTDTSGLLHSFVLRHTSSRELAEEIVQDVFTQIWQTRETLSGINNFKAYLYVVSRNRVINEIKKKLREQKRHQQWIASGSATAVTDDEPGISEEQYGLIEAAVNNLPARQKMAWILHRRNGKTYEQIGREMNISRETVKTYLQHATESLTKYIIQHSGILVPGACTILAGMLGR